jgi:hypothetical protein
MIAGHFLRTERSQALCDLFHTKAVFGAGV